MAASSPLIPIGLLVLLVGLMAALSLVAGVRMITRPMAELSAQLLSRCDQLSPIDPPRNGSLELDRVIASFNQLVMAVGHANEVRRNMLAGLSHDLRTPLARLQLRVDCECPEEVSRRLTPDFDALSKILSQFLAFARSDGKVSLGAQVAVGAIARQIVGQFSSTDFDVTLVEGGDLLVGMPELAMHRILSNLIDNALEHGKAPVRVFLSEKANTLKIIVVDAGAGIPDHLFKLAQEPFTKLRGDQTSLGHSGLGLAIVAQITDQLHGKLMQCRVDGFAGLEVHLPALSKQEFVPK
jgi:two-component system osmolarity sensor histidine kinase EnvZ